MSVPETVLAARTGPGLKGSPACFRQVQNHMCSAPVQEEPVGVPARAHAAQHLAQVRASLCCSVLTCGSAHAWCWISGCLGATLRCPSPSLTAARRGEAAEQQRCHGRTRRGVAVGSGSGRPRRPFPVSWHPPPLPQPSPSCHCRRSFDVDFAFKSPLYRHVASVFFEEVVQVSALQKVVWAAVHCSRCSCCGLCCRHCLRACRQPALLLCTA